MTLNSVKRMSWIMSIVLSAALPAAGQEAFADCSSSLKLEGMISVECCSPQDECMPAGEAIYKYSEAMKDEPSELSICVHASPWRLYDGEMRILTVEELAESVKPRIREGVKRVVLIASWTGVAPDAKVKSLAQRLFELLDGFPVSGMDGFVWLAKDGAWRTTNQAFTLKQKCPYGVHPGAEVMVSLVAGWPVEFEEHYVSERDSEGIMRAGAGWDIYMLCPERALKSFEAAARLSNPIAAYNAALIRLERGKPGDIKAAVALLSQAAALGDEKSRERLERLKEEKKPVS